MTRNVNAIDLDKTLIPFDSFRRLLLNEIQRGDFRILSFVILRQLRLISGRRLKKICVDHLKRNRKKVFFENYACTLIKEINQDVKAIIDKETNQNTKNVLVSASPDLYVSILVIKLGWEGCGSKFSESGEFIHLFGEGKIDYFQENYPPSTFHYNFAISDSSSDDQLLSLFEKSNKWISQ